MNSKINLEYSVSSKRREDYQILQESLSLSKRRKKSRKKVAGLIL